MAEIVHRNLEAMVPQLEELETSAIFSHEEIKSIIKHRRQHEYRMVRRPAHKEDFLAAIQYELHLDLLRKHRKKRLRVTGTRRDADYGIGNRIHGLFRRAVKKFKGDLKLWLQYIEFAKNSNHKLSLSRIYGKALALHPSAISLWVMAAKFQFETMNDVSAARSLLQQGLRANSTSQHLWLEYLRLELLHTDKVRKRREVLQLGEEGEVEESRDDFLSYKIASVVFQEAIKAIPTDVQFRLSVLPVYRLFPDTQSLQEEVYQSLRQDLPCCALTWDALARRQWVESHTLSLKASQLASQVAELETNSEQIFEEGLAAVRLDCSCDGSPGGCGGAGPDARSAALWGCYLSWALERLEAVGTVRSLRKKAEERLVTTFQEPSGCGQLTVETYQDYVKILEQLGQHKTAETVLQAALKTHPSSVVLWVLRLEREGGGKEEGKVYREALRKVPKKDSLPIWQHWLNRIMDTSSQNDVEDIFKSAVTSGCKEVSEPIGVLYVEWGSKVGGLPKARRIYNELMTTPPVPYCLYEKCLELEECGVAAAGFKGDVKRLREVFEKAVRDYGKTNIDLWLKYISMELHTRGGDVGKVGSLHWRAMKTLEPSLTGSFLEQYSLIQTTGSAEHSTVS